MITDTEQVRGFDITLTALLQFPGRATGHNVSGAKGDGGDRQTRTRYLFEHSLTCTHTYLLFLYKHFLCAVYPGITAQYRSRKQVDSSLC